MIKGISLFSNVGIGESYLKNENVDIVVANELLEKRCRFYSHLFPSSNMICGSITEKKIFDSLIEKYKTNNCDFLLATPPCQGMSKAGKMKKDDIRNTLIIDTINFIKEVLPSNIIIENVVGILKFSIVFNDKEIKIINYIKQELEPLGYFINYDIIDASDYNTPQKRKRAIFLISKISKWEFPAKNKKITVRDAIGDLPTLESGEMSNIRHHNAKKHNQNHILWMRNTPTGKSAFDNRIHYPQKDNRRIKGFSTTYKRIKWDEPAPTITMCNGGISSQNNVHAGRLKSDGTYSDARVLSILELIRLTGLPDNWDIPTWASDNLIRQVIGEAFLPRLAEALIKTMPRK